MVLGVDQLWYGNWVLAGNGFIGRGFRAVKFGARKKGGFFFSTVFFPTFFGGGGGVGLFLGGIHPWNHLLVAMWSCHVFFSWRKGFGIGRGFHFFSGRLALYSPMYNGIYRLYDRSINSAFSSSRGYAAGVGGYGRAWRAGAK